MEETDTPNAVRGNHKHLPGIFAIVGKCITVIGTDHCHTVNSKDVNGNDIEVATPAMASNDFDAVFEPIEAARRRNRNKLENETSQQKVTLS